MWYYKQTESFPALYTVGYGEDEHGRFVQTDSDHSDKEAAAARVHYLNGGATLTPAQVAAPLMLEALESLIAPKSVAEAERAETLGRAAILQAKGEA